MEKKTNTMRILEKEGISYSPVYYDLGGKEFSGQSVAETTGIDPGEMLKTLTAKGDKRGYLCFVIPVECELDLKKAARAAGDKRVELVPVKDLLSVTGYLRGEVSPIGMKRRYPTYLSDRVKDFSSVVISAGKKGVSLRLSPVDLAGYLSAEFSALT